MGFVEFFLKIIPLYALIGMGFLVGQRTKLSAADLARVNLQFIAPVIFFEAISRQDFSGDNFTLPLACIMLMGGMLTLVFMGARILASNPKTPYWLSAACANSNLGYFGIPVFMMVFGQENLGLYMLYLAGGIVFFYSAINYQFIRSRYSLREAVHQIARLPVMYAMVLAVLCQVFNWHVPAVFDDTITMIRGSYSVMGMMIIGIVLGRQSQNRKGFVFEWRLILFSNFVRFALYPALAITLVLVNREWLQFFTPMAEKILLLASIMPMGADTTSLAAQWNMHPERIAALTLVNTSLAMIYIPLALPYVIAL